MASQTETNSAAEAKLRMQVRIMAVAAGMFASCAVIIPQLMPRRPEGFTTGMDSLVIFFLFSFLTFAVGVAAPIFAYARAVKIGVRMPAASFAPLALLVAAVIGMIVIGQLRKSTREVEFQPRPVTPQHTQPVE